MGLKNRKVFQQWSHISKLVCKVKTTIKHYPNLIRNVTLGTETFSCPSTISIEI